MKKDMCSGNACRLGSLALFALLSLLLPAVLNAQCAESIGTNVSPEESAWLSVPIESLPRSLEEFSVLPRHDQRAILGRLPAKAKSNLWRDHMSTYLSENLTDVQREVLLEAIRVASPQYFAAAKNRHNSEYGRLKLELAPLKIKAIKAFGFEKAREMFTQIQPVGELAQVATVTEQPNDSCACEIGDDWCSFGRHCDHSTCTVVKDDCGWWAADDCNGACNVNGHALQ